MTVYAMQGGRTKELLSYRGRVLIHDNRAELEWLFPIRDFRVIELRGRLAPEVAMRLGRRVLWLKKHPDMAAVRWPLRKGDFL